MGKYSHLSHEQIIKKADLAIQETSDFRDNTKTFIKNSEYGLIMHSRLETLNVPEAVKESLYNFKYQ